MLVQNQDLHINKTIQKVRFLLQANAWNWSAITKAIVRRIIPVTKEFAFTTESANWATIVILKPFVQKVIAISSTATFTPIAQKYEPNLS